jgi:hypothetical protein
MAGGASFFHYNAIDRRKEFFTYKTDYCISFDPVA